jgi:hypothetical protein
MPVQVHSQFKPCGSICKIEPAQSIRALKATTDFTDYTDFFVSSVLGSWGTARRKGQKQTHPHENGDRPNLIHYASSLLYLFYFFFSLPLAVLNVRMKKNFIIFPKTERCKIIRYFDNQEI